MSDLTPAPRRYTDEEVRALLERASQLQHTEQPGAMDSTGLTLPELQRIAEEAGIDPGAVRRAADELELGMVGEGSTVARRLAGAPTRVVLDRVLTGELGPPELEAVIPIIQTAAGINGQASLVGSTLTWQAHGPNAARDLQVMVTSREGETRIRIEERYGNLAGGLFGGIVGGAGGGVGLGVGMGVGAAIGSTFMMVAFPIAAFGAAYVGCRAIYSGIVHKRREVLQRLLADLTAALGAEPEPGERALDDGSDPSQ